MNRILTMSFSTIFFTASVFAMGDTGGSKDKKEKDYLAPLRRQIAESTAGSQDAPTQLIAQHQAPGVEAAAKKKKKVRYID